MKHDILEIEVDAKVCYYSLYLSRFHYHYILSSIQYPFFINLKLCCNKSKARAFEALVKIRG